MNRQYFDLAKIGGSEFNDEGFLSEEALARIKSSIRSTLRPELDLARRINLTLHKKKFDVHIEPTSVQEILLATLLIRQLNTFAAVVHLSEIGLASDAATLTRATFENLVYSRLFAKDEAACHGFLATDDADRLKILKSFEPKSAYSEKHYALIRELTEKSIPKRNLRADATKVNLNKEYDTMYRFFSTLSAHPSPRALQSVVKIQEGKLSEFSYVNDAISVQHTVHVSAMFLLQSVDAIFTHFKQDVSDIHALADALDELTPNLESSDEDA